MFEIWVFIFLFCLSGSFLANYFSSNYSLSLFLLDTNAETSVGQAPEEVANFMKSSGHLWMKIASKVDRVLQSRIRSGMFWSDPDASVGKDWIRV